ncbi:peptidoglycan recognition protein family protein [Micromonospora aurantiaca (nom. illeg.)]|uniref:peptidoglycan recognition protein family protein n=1 Tax=Micromonospora aurantiaca (nom. illeg.) TaxID=47850 RepID=UPI003410C676
MPIGWSLGGRTVAAMLGLYPRSQAVRVFFEPGKGLPASAWSDPRSPLAQLPAGATVVVSHKDLGVDALAFVTAWLTHRPDVDLILIAHHEPEQQEGGDPTPTQFRASWTRQRQQVGGHPARAEGRLRLAVCYTLQWIRAGGNWRTWWPEHEADAVDLVLFDWYQYLPGARNPYRPHVYEDPAAAIAPMTAIATEVGKPWGVAEADHLRITLENGCPVDLDPDGELCADWYRRMYAAARAAGSQLWCHYHARHGDLTERLPEQRALRDLIIQEDTVSRLLWLPQVLRAAGLTAHEVDGWRTRGSSTYDPRGVICHATAGSSTSTDAGEIRVLLEGSTSAPPPIAQLYLSRSGAFHVVASGRCNHALQGWGGNLKGYGNTNLIGIEAQNDNRGQPWPAVQLDAYQRGVAAICKHMGWSANKVAAHREHQPGAKSDPSGIDMTAFRARVTAILAGKDDDMANFTADHAKVLDQLGKLLPDLAAQTAYTDGRMEAMAHGRTEVRKDLRGGGQPVWLVQAVLAVRDGLAQVDGKVGAQLADDFARIEQAVAAAGEADAQRDADHAAKLGELAELVRAGQSGQLAADEVLRRMGEVLTAGTTAQG